LAQVAEYLPGKLKPLKSNSCTAKSKQPKTTTTKENWWMAILVQQVLVPTG
jgi:hypothetical protein